MPDSDTPPRRYSVLLADPPWRYEVWTGPDTPRTADRHYATMSYEQLAHYPVPVLAETDAVLLLWATAPVLPTALSLLEVWGFVYKTVAFVWEKVDLKGQPALGMGHYTRANAEFCLFGVRGKGVARVGRGVSQIIRARTREHSRKPDEVYSRVEQLFGAEVPRLELFSRTPWPGWDHDGQDAGRFSAQLPLLLPTEDEEESA